MDQDKVVEIHYTNWRGVTKRYRILPHSNSMRFGRTEYHTTPQWLFDATNCDTGEQRTFALAGLHDWKPSLDQSKVWRK